MRLQEVLSNAEARPISHNPDLKREVRSGFASDLMSDVLCYDVAQGLLITGLTNPQIIRTAEMADVAAILVVRGKMPPSETVDLAEQLDIPMIGTNLIMFESCGRLFAAGLPPCKRQNG
jgi:predicted transcriptional regulator